MVGAQGIAPVHPFEGDSKKHWIILTEKYTLIMAFADDRVEIMTY